MASKMNTTVYDRLKAVAQVGDIEDLYKLIQDESQVGDLLDMAETPLHVAASAGHLQFATGIMRLKPSFAWKLNQQGFSPIHLAMQHGQNRMVLRFLEINKNLVRVKGREGLTPLHLASQTGEIELLANFLSVCPNSIEDVTVRGETALHIAVKNQQFEALQVLVDWLKRNHQRGAMQLEKEILNWKDEAGNTILHISVLLNDPDVVSFLVNTKIDLKAKNLENSTALDRVASTEIKNILIGAGAKPGPLVIDAPTLADEQRLKITIMHKIIIFILRIRRDLSTDHRNTFLVVAALVATATYQLALSPPGGVYQANAGDNNTNITSLNSTAPTTPGNAGKSVISEGDFITLSGLNTLAFLVSITTIYILTPTGIVGSLLFGQVSWFAYCYLYSMMAISPPSAASLFNHIVFYCFSFLHIVVWLTFAVVYKRLKGHLIYREIEIKNSTGTNRW